jgi:membrane associated rhomboid family serine protease
MFPIRDTIPSRNPPIMTWIIILVNSLVFLFELSMPEYSLKQLFYLFGIVPARYTHPGWALAIGLPIDDFWPFLTSMFLHGSWMHIIGNMWTLWIFGDNVEERMGPVRFLFFYVLCGIAAGLVHWYTIADSTIPTVGASGAIAGVMGAYFLLFPYARVIVLVPVLFFPFFFELPAVTYLGFWALTQLFGGTLSLGNPGDVGGVSWWAHVGGFASGILLQFLFVKRKDAYRRPSRDEYEIENAWVPASYWRNYR